MVCCRWECVWCTYVARFLAVLLSRCIGHLDHVSIHRQIHQSPSKPQPQPWTGRRWDMRAGLRRLPNGLLQRVVDPIGSAGFRIFHRLPHAMSCGVSMAETRHGCPSRRSHFAPSCGPRRLCRRPGPRCPCMRPNTCMYSLLRHQDLSQLDLEPHVHTSSDQSDHPTFCCRPKLLVASAHAKAHARKKKKKRTEETGLQEERGLVRDAASPLGMQRGREVFWGVTVWHTAEGRNQGDHSG
jgi:hypothetical protein